MLMLIATVHILFETAFGLEQVNCQQSKNYNDLILCVIEKSPDVQSAVVEVNRARAQFKAAGQFKNPQLSVNSVRGRLGSEARSETDISLGVPLELGGKISARESVANSAILNAEARLYEAQSNVKTQLILRLHRLRQVLHEQEIIDEAINTFSKLISQYKRRPTLSPEQQVSLSVYQLSLGSYQLQKAVAQEELAEVEAYLEFNLGMNLGQVQKFLPSAVSAWPVSTNLKIRSDSPQIRLLESDVSAAKADLAVARSESWPTVMVGPTFRLQQETGQTGQMAGANINLSLPLFNTNGKARSAAAAAVTLSETRKHFAFRDLEVRRFKFIQVYEQSVKVLSSSLSHSEIEKRHRDAEQFFNRGIVSSALIVEAHRTSLDLEKSRHQRELKALESLINIFVLDGAILEETL